MRVTPGQTMSNITIARELVSDQGVRSLFSGLFLHICSELKMLILIPSGLTPRLLKVAPACAIMISSYEFCKEFFGNQNRMK